MSAFGPRTLHSQKVYLKHSQEQVFFSTLVLVPIYCKHHSLQQSIDFCHCDKAAKMCYVSRLGLKEKQEISIFLRFIIVGKEAFLNLSSVFEMTRNFVLLYLCEHVSRKIIAFIRTSSKAIRF